MKYQLYPTTRKRGTILLRPMGFEFTFEKVGEPEDYNYEPTLTHLRKIGYRGYDDNCLEINSPIFKFAEDVILFWKKLRKDLGKEFVPRNPTSTGGGTHIHVGMKPDLKRLHLTGAEREFRKKFISVLWNRPWLTWAFQDPSDDYSSEPVCSKKYNLESLQNFDYMEIASDNMDALSKANLPYSYCDNPNFGCKSESIRITNHLKTVELRFFDTVENEIELKTIIQVTNRLLEMATTLLDPEPITIKSVPKLYKMLTNGSALNQYKKFLQDGGIEHTFDKIRTRASFCRKMKKLTTHGRKINIL